MSTVALHIPYVFLMYVCIYSPPNSACCVHVAFVILIFFDLPLCRSLLLASPSISCPHSPTLSYFTLVSALFTVFPPHICKFCCFLLFFIVALYGQTLNGLFWCHLGHTSPGLTSRLSFMLCFNYLILNGHIKIPPYMDGLR